MDEVFKRAHRPALRGRSLVSLEQLEPDARDLLLAIAHRGNQGLSMNPLLHPAGDGRLACSLRTLQILGEGLSNFDDPAMGLGLVELQPSSKQGPTLCLSSKGERLVGQTGRMDHCKKALRGNHREHR